MISVIIPMLNEEKLILPCLKQLLKQTASGFEVIVVDNGSSDESVERADSMVEEFAERGIGLHILSEPEGCQVEARALGIVKAKGEIIASLDADSFVAPDWIEQIQSHFEKHPACPGVGGSMKWRDRNFFMNTMAALFFRLSSLTGSYYFWALNCAYPKAAFEEVGGFSELQKILTTHEFNTPKDDLFLSHKLGHVHYEPKIKVTALVRIEGNKATPLEVWQRLVQEWKANQKLKRLLND